MSFTERWRRPAGYREILQLALPLVISTSSWSIQTFVDRMFLAWYTPRAMAAALPASMLVFTLISFFIGVASYANTFVAQYHGAGQPRRVGAAIWQSIYFSLAAGALLPLIALFTGDIFRWIGHEPVIQPLECTFFRILLVGSVFSIYSNAVSCFYTGLGRNWPVMWVNTLAMLVNILLDYAMIFGHWGFPELGIAGAAWATVTAQGVGAVIFTMLYFLPGNDKEFATRSAWRPDFALFRRLLRFGAPSGMQILLDMMAFTFFVFIVGRIGTRELAATNLAFQVNTLAFMPMIGFGIAASTMVAKWLGSNQPAMAARATWSAFHLAISYMAAISLCYVLFPAWFIDPFAAKSGDLALFTAVRPMAIQILYFVAAYCLFDTLNIIFASALRGAGDTRFVMLLSVSLGWSIMGLPTWWLCGVGHHGIYTAWLLLSLYVVVVGFGFLARFLQGKWRTMRVIESHHLPPVGVALPLLPTEEVDL